MYSVRIWDGEDLNPLKICRKGSARKPIEIMTFIMGTSAAKPAPIQWSLPIATRPTDPKKTTKNTLFHKKEFRFSDGNLSKNPRQRQIARMPPSKNKTLIILTLFQTRNGRHHVFMFITSCKLDLFNTGSQAHHGFFRPWLPEFSLSCSN